VLNDHEWMSCVVPVIEAADIPNLTVLGEQSFQIKDLSNGRKFAIGISDNNT